jgi:hypothetical protein
MTDLAAVMKSDRGRDIPATTILAGRLGRTFQNRRSRPALAVVAHIVVSLLSIQLIAPHEIVRSDADAGNDLSQRNIG